jgi:putative DNA methylase
MTPHPVKRRKKLIEVAIPLEAINAASAREKSIRHGHPSTLHLWWARRPLAAARAVIFCQMVDDPSAVPEEFPTEEDQEKERLRLFVLISKLVLWENTTEETVLEPTREEIRRSWRRCCADNADHPEAAELFNPEKLPGFHDPFAGGGALPLEAQRLGLEAYASDLNPVAVLINKAMIEIPPKFAGMPPVNPESRSKKQLIAREWKGAEGLAEDVRYYGQRMRDEAEKRIGHLYPKMKITPEMVNDPENPRPDLKPYEGQELTVIAWIWARTVKSPNPAFSQVEVPLASTFMLSQMKNKEAYVQPIVEGECYRFLVKVGKPTDAEKAKSGTKADGRGAHFHCVMSQSLIPGDYLKVEGMAGRIGARLMAIVAEGNRGRIYLSPTPQQSAAAQCKPDDCTSSLELPKEGKGRTAFWCKLYGLTAYEKLFTSRQHVALSTFSDLVGKVQSQIQRDALEASLLDDGLPLRDGGLGRKAYAEAICVFLGLVVSSQSDRMSSICTWDAGGKTWGTKTRNTFARQAIPMSWDYAEVNPFSSQSGSFANSLDYTSKGIYSAAESAGFSVQQDASCQALSLQKVISTDPPYYDNIGYADLSDFFYLWLRRSLRGIFPGLFVTLAVPKAEELVAIPYRHGSKDKAEQFFLDGMTRAMHRLAIQSHAGFPITIYYAFKQSENKGEAGAASTGWETFLAAVIEAELAITGTWPMRTELANRMIGAGANALASSVVLVCQRRDPSAALLTRNTFRRELRQRLPQAIKELEHANIAPVDVAQAAIGPGMAIYSQSKAVLNPDDSPMSVREALIEINAALDEHLSQDEGAFDADTRFALTFFESFGYSERPYGDAEGLAVARNISVDGVVRAGILRAAAGKAQLLRREQLEDTWDPTQDDRLCVWEATQQLIKRLEADGEGGAATLLLQLRNLPGHGDLAANCRALAYRLYNHCEKTKQAEEARSYNGLVIAWPELERQASAASTAQSAPLQTSLI